MLQLNILHTCINHTCTYNAALIIVDSNCMRLSEKIDSCLCNVMHWSCSISHEYNIFMIEFFIFFQMLMSVWTELIPVPMSVQTLTVVIHVAAMKDTE